MLAGTQAVDTEIHAVTGELPPAHVANFHRVGEATAGFDAEVRKNWMLRVEVGNAEFLGSRAQSAAVDFVLIRRSPIVERWD